MEHLQDDRAVVLQVPREVDGGGAAAAQLPFDRVVRGECCADLPDARPGCRSGHTARRLRTQLGYGGGERLVRRGAELGAEEVFVGSGVPQRACPISRSRQRLHKAQGVPRIEWIERREATAPLYCRGMVAARRGGGREGFAGAAEALGEACALGIRPALELRRTRQEETIEKRTLVQRDRPLQLALREGRFELLDVGRHDLRVQPELVGSEEQLLRVEVAAQRVQRLRQEMSRLLLTAFGPEAGEQLVAAHTESRRRGGHHLVQSPARMDLPGSPGPVQKPQLAVRRPKTERRRHRYDRRREGRLPSPALMRDPRVTWKRSVA